MQYHNHIEDFALPGNNGRNNAILTLSRANSSNYTSQLGFTRDGMAYRAINGADISTATWKKILMDGDKIECGNISNYSDGYVTNNANVMASLISGEMVNIFAGMNAITSYSVGNQSSAEIICERVNGANGANAQWENFSTTDDIKIQKLFSGSNESSRVPVAYDSSSPVVGDKLRFTIYPNTRYAILHFLYVWFSINGNQTKITVEHCTWNTTNKLPNNDWTILHDNASISGWSGPNVYAINKTFGQTNGSNGYGLRITFELTKINSGYETATPEVYSIKGFTKQKPWSISSSASYLAGYGHPYFIDASDNIVFDRNLISKSNKSLNVGNESKYWNGGYFNNLYTKKVTVTGAYSSTAYLYADTSTNFYISINNTIPFVIDAKTPSNVVIRSSNAYANSVDLGTSTTKFRKMYLMQLNDINVKDYYTEMEYI